MKFLFRLVLQQLAKAQDRQMSKEIEKVKAAYLLLSTGILPTTSDANAATLIKAGVRALGDGRACRLLLWRVTRKTGRNPLGDDAGLLGDADLSQFFEAL